MSVDAARPLVATRDDRDERARRATPVDIDALASLLGDVLAAEGVPASAEASLQMVSPERIAELNEQHLGAVGPTDVLSFPLDGIVDDDSDDDGASGGSIVGDVVVCPEVAAAQASDHAGDLASELALLVVHGGLHLCGWDHDGESEQTRMWERERRLMDDLGRSPLRDPWSPR